MYYQVALPQCIIKLEMWHGDGARVPRRSVRLGVGKRSSLVYHSLYPSVSTMAPRRKTTASPKLRPKKRRGQASYSYPMPDLFPRSVRTLLRQRYTHIPDNHHLSQVSEEQIPGFIERAWEHADPDTQAHFCRLANGLPGIQPRSVETGPVVSDVQPPPRKSSRARGKKASARSRAKRTAPPTVQDQPETPPSHSGLDHTFPPTPHSTSSSVSIPLHTVVRSGGPPAPDAGSAPHAQRPDDALLPDMPPFPPNNSHRGGGPSSGPRSSFPFVPPAYAYGLPPLDHGQAPGPTAYPGEPVNGGAHPISGIDLSLLDEQRRTRDQMRDFYYQSLGYAHMSAATEHWPWR